jgi:pimeloyl-ACP methyl ester carboxylesterase
LDVRTETSLSAAERALGLPESRWLEAGGPIHYREWPGPADGAVSVLVHGLGGSLLNWALVAPDLARRGRVLALDLPGFGRTPAAGRGSGVASSARALARFLRAMDLESVFLFGSSMGGMVAVEHAGIDPASVRGLVLVNAALPPVGSPVRGVPTEVAAGFLTTGAWRLGPAILRTRTDRLGAERMARRTLAYCTAHPDRLEPAWVTAAVEEFRRWSAGPDAADVFSEASRSIVRTFTFPRGYRRLLAEIRTPAIVLHGAADRLIPTANAWQAAREHANWDLVVLPDVGHIPQVEDPARFLDVVGAWLDRAAA